MTLHIADPADGVVRFPERTRPAPICANPRVTASLCRHTDLGSSVAADSLVERDDRTGIKRLGAG